MNTGKIVGTAEDKERIKNATPQDTLVLVSLDPLENLPEQYTAKITSVTFDYLNLEKHFTNTGSKNQPSWYPHVELMLDIAKAKGVEKGDTYNSESIIEEVDVNPLLMKGFESEPTYRKIHVGARVEKNVSALMEDGSSFSSPVCVSEYNAWLRCKKAWSKEEEETQGYTVPLDSYGKYKNPWGKMVPCKYNNRFKRQSHFDQELQTAQSKADTNSFTKAVRWVAGLKTGYPTNELGSGKFLFVKIIKSVSAINKEQNATLENIRTGGNPSAPAQKALFGTPEPAPELTPEPEPPAEPQGENKTQEAIKFLEKNMDYLTNKKEADSALTWLKKTPSAHEDTGTWPRIETLMSNIKQELGL